MGIPQFTANKYGVAVLALGWIPVLLPYWWLAIIPAALALRYIDYGDDTEQSIIAHLLGGTYYHVEFYAIILIVANLLKFSIRYT